MPTLKLDKLNLPQIRDRLQEVCGDKLRWNTLDQQIEYLGKPVNPDALRVWFYDTCDAYAPIDLLVEVLNDYARQYAYSPVKEYLERVSTDVEPINIKSLATRYFGTSDPLYDTFMFKILIAAVRRVYEPGCISENAVILQGAQGCGKTSFWHTIGNGWTTNSVRGAMSNDELMVMHGAWIIEYGEFGKITRKRDMDEIKNFMSTYKDSFRAPYARTKQDHLRSFIIVGSVNETNFLVDPTGSRRFWIVPVETNNIDIERLELERDAIWSAAIAAYKSGEISYLTKEEDKLNTEHNNQYEAEDPWLALIENYVITHNNSKLLTSTILDEILKLPAAQQTRAVQMKLSGLLKSANWRQYREKNIRGYEAPESLIKSKTKVSLIDRLKSQQRLT